ncbi:MAG: DUF3137 domain-containing protein [Elusimicrobiota bacterium]|nr:DUF3137 domain-containing protein [Elusimicrobiota bacterium]
MPKVWKGGGKDNFFWWSFSVAPVNAGICAVSGAVAFIVFSLVMPGRNGRRPIIESNDEAFLPAVAIGLIAFFICIAAYAVLLNHRDKFGRQLALARELEREIMADVALFFGLYYKDGPIFSPEDLLKTGITKYSEFFEIRHPLAGAPEGYALEITEIKFKIGETKHGSVMREGLVALYHLNKNFKGVTLLFEDSFSKKINYAFNPDMTRVKLEWPLFEEAFDLYTTSQVDARIVMDTDFMETVYDFHKRHGIGGLFIAFYDNKMIVFLDNTNWPHAQDGKFYPAGFYDNMDFLLQIPRHMRYKSFAMERFVDRAGIEKARAQHIRQKP